MHILIFFIILLILVLVHEFGHFFAAKKLGILVEEFGFGFPPRVIGRKIGETLYSLNLLPIGGFVKVFGEEYTELKDKKLDGPLKNRTFAYKKPWEKSLVVVAGVIMNFILGWILISYLYTQGVPTPVDKVIIEQVQPNSPAAHAGLRQGQVLTELIKNDKRYRLTSANDLIILTKKFAGSSLTLIVTDKEKSQTITLTPRTNPPAGQGPLGVSLTSYVEKKYPWYQAPFYGLKEAFSISVRFFTELGKTLVLLATFQKPTVDVAGPVGIAQFTGQALKLGQNAVLELMALLSLNLAVVNILPFPALDGGRLVFIIYEWITKRRVNQTFEQRLNLFGIIVLLGLAALITVHDIMKLLK